MEPTLAASLPAIRTLCQRMGVRALWVFGSAAEDPAGNRFERGTSDFDFIVDFGETDLSVVAPVDPVPR